MQVTHASQMPTPLASTTFLPLAVACQYAAMATGKPAALMADMFLACFASCLNRECCVQIYPETDPHFKVRGRFWATPTGEPNAGKSPTFDDIKPAFLSFMQAHKKFFPWLQNDGVHHLYGAGTHAGFNETMRDTGGVVLFIGPEACILLDPAFLTKKVVDTKSYCDIRKLLECASGGLYEFLTATDIRNARATRKRKKESAQESQTLGECVVDMSAALSSHGLNNDKLVFPSTSVNMCLFQQDHVFEDWWVPVERKFKLGFSVRILFSFCQRAVVRSDLGRQPSQPVKALMTHLWKNACNTSGHSTTGDSLKHTFSLQGQKFFN